jgi:DNA-binding NtrC family response regulator
VHGVSDAPKVILLVDDEPGVLRIMTRILERAGHEVRLCSTCAEVEALLTSGLRPHLVITDVVLDGGTGNCVAAIVRRLSPGTRVVFMSGYGNVGVPGQCVLHKPFSARELVELVDQVLSAGSPDVALERGVAFEARRRKGLARG